MNSRIPSDNHGHRLFTDKGGDNSNKDQTATNPTSKGQGLSALILGAGIRLIKTIVFFPATLLKGIMRSRQEAKILNTKKRYKALIIQNILMHEARKKNHTISNQDLLKDFLLRNANTYFPDTMTVENLSKTFLDKDGEMLKLRKTIKDGIKNAIYDKISKNEEIFQLFQNNVESIKTTIGLWLSEKSLSQLINLLSNDNIITELKKKLDKSETSQTSENETT
ncbi:MAG: hypothetical protein KDK55_04225 [Chlamydiia bacterium]|nr:hypothetical protein [Chlamydiia bacterium]